MVQKVLAGREPLPLSMGLSSLGLITAKVASLALGFVFWFMAARRFPPATVGLAAAVVSAMMFCVQLALVGVNAAFISVFPAQRRQPVALLNTSLSVVGGTATLMAGMFLVAGSLLLSELGVVASTPAFAALFVGLTVLGTIGVLLDHVSMAFGRGDQALTRNVLFGVIALCPMPLLGSGASAAHLVSLWAAGGLAALLLGMAQLAKSTNGYRFAPRAEASLARRLVRIGLPNYALTLTERVPQLLLPVLVTELLSPEANAYWYAAWMMAWVAYIVPMSVGTALFAEIAHRPHAAAEAIRRAIRSSFLFGLPAAGALAIGAPLGLSLLGSDYAVTGATPLRILLVGILPVTFIQAYFAICRARASLNEAIITGAIAAVLGVVGTALAGNTSGLVGMALAWVGAQSVVGVWCAFRVRVRLATLTPPDARLAVGSVSA